MHLCSRAGPSPSTELASNVEPTIRSSRLRSTVMRNLISMILASSGQFWPAFTRCSRRQARLLVWFYVAVCGEGLLFGFLSANYGKYQHYGLYNILAEGLLLPNISEWHLLLTPFVFPNKEATVSADILCTDFVPTNRCITERSSNIFWMAVRSRA